MAKKANWKNIVVAGLALAAVAISTGTLVHVSRNEETKNLSTFSYQRGEVDAETGKIDEDAKTALVSGYVSVEGLEIDFKTDAEVTVNLHFFTEDEEFISSVTEIETDYVAADTVLPENAEKAIIEIVPTDDSEISWLEISEYAGMIDVSFAK